MQVVKLCTWLAEASGPATALETWNVSNCLLVYDCFYISVYQSFESLSVNLF